MMLKKSEYVIGDYLKIVYLHGNKQLAILTNTSNTDTLAHIWKS